MSGIGFTDNVLHRVKTPEIAAGFRSKKVKLKRADNGLLYPASKSLASVGVARTLTPVSKSQTGVSWYAKSESGALFGSGKTINIKPGIGALAEAIKKAEAGDMIQLAAGDYLVSKILIIDKPLTIKGRKGVNLEFERPTVFEVVNGGSLELKNLNISGKSSPDYVNNSVIRTSRYSMLENYQIRVEDCEVSDLDVNRAFNFLNVSKSTMADNIEIVDSSFSDVSGAILKLDKETDDFGIYNAEYVTIKDSNFRNVQGALIDYYRGGTDESSFGPHFSLTGSELNGVGVGSKNKSQASIWLHGVQVTHIKGNTFVNSPAIRIEHTVGEPVTRIVKNTFKATPLPKVKELHSQKVNTAVIKENTVR